MMNRLLKMIKQRNAREKLYSTAEYWDSKARSYNDTAVSMWPNQALNLHYDDEQKMLLQELLGEVRGRHILDLGCGTGRFARWFAAQGAQVTGTDFSSGALSIAQKHSPDGNPVYRHASVFEIAEYDRYDVVFTWGVLTIACHDREQLRKALRQVHQALKPGAYLLLTEPVHRGFLHRVLNMSLPEFLAIMTESGFRIERTVPLHFWPMRLCLAYVAWPAWLTTPLYHIGQALMRLPGLSRLGDYWAIVAFPVKHEPSPDQLQMEESEA